MLNYRTIGILLALSALVGCRVQLAAPEGGSVATQSGAYRCAESSECVVEISDTGFHETFTAQPAPGFIFAGWQKEHLGLCGGSLEPCRIDASLAAGHPALMELLASDQEFTLSAQFLPEQEVRRYMPGDSVRFEGVISGDESLFPVGGTDVSALMDVLATNREQDGFPVLEGRLTVYEGEQHLQHQWSVSFWQDDQGGLHTLTDEYGNLLLNTSANQGGVVFFPAPLESFSALDMTYAAMWGGHTSTPITDGDRSITVGAPALKLLPAGNSMVYPVTVIDEISYLVSYADYNKGQSLEREYNLMVSREKGLVSLNVSQLHFSRTGVLLDTFKLSLDAVNFNF